MGVATPKKILNTIAALSGDDLFTIAKAVRDKKDPSSSRNPHIALDASVWAHKYKDKGLQMPAHIVDLAAHFAAYGVDVTIFCDRTNYRHDSKRDSVRRYAEVEMKKARLIKLRLEMMKLHGMVKDRVEGIDVKTVEAKLSTVGKEVEALEKSIRESPLSQLYSQLSDVMSNKVLGPDSGNLDLKEALFQADAAIAFEAVKGTVDIIGSNDSDFHVLAGPAGIVISDLKFSPKKKHNGGSIHSIKIACGQWSPIEYIIGVLHIRPDSKVVTRAKHPVLEGQPLRVRALIAVAIGCDANPGGIPGVGPAKIESVLSELSRDGTEYYQGLLRWLGNHSKKHTEREIEVLSETILYEPGNCTNEDGDAGRKYLATPTMASHYHAEFVQDEDILVSEEEDVALCICKGVRASSPHKFLRSEGTYTCTDCGADLCRFCCCVDKENGHISQCMPCFSGAVAGVNDDNGDEATPAVATDATVDAMRKELVGANIPEARTASTQIILDLYDEYILDGRVTVCDGIEDRTAMPLRCSDDFDDLEPIVEFSFGGGGAVLRREELSDKDRYDVLSLLAASVDYSKSAGATHAKAKGAMKSAYAASPDLFVAMAGGCRQHSGYRLLSRGWRGAMDGDAPSLFDADCFFARNSDGQICLGIKGQVRASYKDELYDTDVAITENAMYACRCSCKVGCTGTNRHSCVHPFAKSMQLPIVMFDGFADSLLVELAAHLGGTEPDLAAEEKKRLEHSIHTLNSCSSTKLGDKSESSSIVQLLASYAVGTERAKKSLLPPSKKEMGPISNLGKDRKPEQTAIDLMNDLREESLVNGTWCIQMH